MIFEGGDRRLTPLECSFRSVDGYSLVTVSEVSVHSNNYHAEVRVVGPNNREWLRTRLNMSADQTVSRLGSKLDGSAATMVNGWETELRSIFWQVIDYHQRGDALVNPWDGELTDIAWMAEPWWLAATTVLFGPGGSGKSYLALSLAIEVATGVQMVSKAPPPNPGPVLYLDWEADVSTMRTRMHALCSAHELPRPDVAYKPMRMPMSMGARQIVRHIDDEGFVGVVVDSAGAARGGSPESAEETVRLFSAIREIEVPALVIDHVAKAAFKEKADKATPFGSVYTLNFARLVWAVNTEWRGSGFTLSAEATKANDLRKPDAQHLQLDMAGGEALWTTSDRSAQTDRTSVADQMQSLLLTYGGMTTADLASAIGCPQNTVRVTGNRAKERFYRLGESWFLVSPNEESPGQGLIDPM